MPVCVSSHEGGRRDLLTSDLDTNIASPRHQRVQY